jgi:asparagine synthase (glutamine-hydrolysing)
MPGIAGVVSSNMSAHVDEAIANMLSAIQYRNNTIISTYKKRDIGVALGCCSLNVMGPKQQPLYNTDKSLSIFIDGEIYGDDTVSYDYCELVSACEELKDTRFRNIKGQFSVAAFDEVRNHIILVTDKFGQRPLYYATTQNGFAFASEIKSLLTLGNISKKTNIQAFADCYHFGFVMGNKTLFSEIHLVPPASVLTFDIASGKIALKKYWELHDLFTSCNISNNSLNETVEAFVNGVKRRTGSDERLGISLSGGLDSRAILAALGNKSRGISSYTLGLSGCKDQIIASQLSSICGTEHSFLEISQDDLSDFHSLAHTLVYHSDGLYHPHESTEKRALDYFSTSPFNVVLRGHGGEIAKAALAYPVQASTDMCVDNMYENGVSSIYKLSNLGLKDIDPCVLFDKRYCPDIYDSSWTSVNESLLPAKNLMNNADLCVYFYVNEWIRRQVLASLSIFKSQVEVRMPYLDEDFLYKLLKMPVQNRFNGEVQIEIVRQCAPKLVKIANSNTGAPLDAGKMKLFVFDKVNSLMQRTGLTGHRHYTEFEKWQREQFKKSIQEIIFSKKALDRGIYKPEGLEMVFQQHVTGKKQYGHLLGTIVAIELWHRLFVD